MSSEEELKRNLTLSVNRRKGHKGQLGALVKLPILSRDAAKIKMEKIRERLNSIEKLDTEIVTILTLLEMEVDDEIESSIAYLDKIMPVLFEAEIMAETDLPTSDECNDFRHSIEHSDNESKSNSESEGSQSDESNSTKSKSKSKTHKSKPVRVKLPELKLNNFDGDIMQFFPWWENYKMIIHDRDDLSEIVKFNYLLQFVSGSARKSIETLMCTAENYNYAIDILHDTYGRKEVVINATMLKLNGLAIPLNRASDLRKFYQDVVNCTNMLETMGMKPESYESMVAPTLMRKLPESIKIRLAQLESGGIWKIRTLIKHLKEEVKIREDIDLNEKTFGKTSRFEDLPSHQTSQGSVTSLFSGEGNRRANEGNASKYCAFCSKHGDHWSDRCSVYADLIPRKKRLDELHKCFRCLRIGHHRRQCSSTKTCFTCGGTHHTSVHETIVPITVPKEKKDDQELAAVANPLKEIHDKSKPQTPKATTTITTCDARRTIAKEKKNTFLQTAKVMLTNPATNKSVVNNATALFDLGSKSSHITSANRNELGLTEIQNLPLIIDGIGGTSTEKPTDQVSVVLNNRDGSFAREIKVYEMDVIARDFESPEIPSDIVEKFDLADWDENGSTKHIDILIGADYYWSFMDLNSFVRLNEDFVAMKSVFGYILSGADDFTVSPNEQVRTSAYFNVGGLVTQPISFESEIITEEPLEKLVSRCWEIEAIGVKHSETTDDFMDGIVLKNGRYCVQLPWKYQKKSLPSNRIVAQKRLNSLFKRLSQKPNLLHRYDSVIRDQIEEGIVSIVPDCDLTKCKHFLPHRAVVNEDRKTTKVRIVFDGSARAAPSALSLNDCLYTGPSLMPEVLAVLLKMRNFPLLLVTDIERAFLNVAVTEEDSFYLSFLWKMNEEIQVLKFNRVMFGLNCSPFLLNATLQYHLKKSAENHPEANLINSLKFYVDDGLFGAISDEEAMKIYEITTKILSEAGFNLRKWSSTSEAVLENIGRKETHEKSVVLDVEQKLLGVPWDRKEDTLSVDLSKVVVDENEPLTKRTILKIAHSVFDPLGFLSPVLLKPRLMMQRCVDFTWDQEVPLEMKSDFFSWVKDIDELENLTFDRCYFDKDVFPDTNVDELIGELSIHGFADASESGYAAVIYVVSQDKDMNRRCSFVLGKSRVAPVKHLSIPRLELLAALILTRMVKFLLDAWSCNLEEIQLSLWSDSLTVLHWIYGNKDWTQWVMRRVQEILDQVGREHWNYVPTEKNPADWGTRELTCQRLLSSSWLSGPDWLLKESEYPEQPVDFLSTGDSLREVKKCALLLNITGEHDYLDEEPDEYQVLNVEKYDTLRRLKRVTAYVLRAIDVMKGLPRKKSKFLTSQETESAMKKLVEIHQRRYFKNKDLNSDSVMKNMNLFWDEEGDLRCRGRLAEASPFLENQPVVLEGNDHFSLLVIRDAHERCMHLGTNGTMGTWRDRYYIIHGRTVTKRLVKNCVVCRRFNARRFDHPQTANLAAFRVAKGVPFSHTGVDFAGPILYEREDEQRGKGYICIFSCATTRAIHIEVTQSMNLESFLFALRNFCSLWGIPKMFISDNAKVFRKVGESFRELADLIEGLDNEEQFQDFLTANQIEWNYIIPKAPWWGGAYERMIGTVKRCLKKSIGTKCLSLEELTTFVREAQACVNSRPLGVIEGETTEKVFSPSEILIGKNLLSLPDRRDMHLMADARVPLPEIFRIRNSMRRNFWEQWKNQYLLERRDHWRNTPGRREDAISPKINELVLIEDSSLPRMKWRIGIVQKLNVGRDGKIRSVELRCGGKDHIQRSVNVLYPLEVC